MMAPRVFLVWLLGLVLALTGGTMAVMRGQMALTTQIVICTGTGPEMIMLDADGNRVEHAHPCPHCTLSMVAADLPGPAMPVRPERLLAAGPALVPPLPRANRPVVTRARGPPLV